MSFASALESAMVPWPAKVAWLIACVCGLLGWRRRRALERLRPGAASEFIARLVQNNEASDETARRLAIAELNERLSEVAFELGVLPATYTALTRISLASGSALALASFLASDSASPVLRAVGLAIAAAGGLVGAGAVLAIGRSARARAAEIREAWDRSSREVGKALGSGLAGAGAGAMRGN